MRIRTRGPTVKVSCPYDTTFITGAKDIGGRFILADRIWLFRMQDFQRVLSLCRAVFGDDCVDDKILRIERSLLSNRIGEIDQLLAERQRMTADVS